MNSIKQENNALFGKIISQFEKDLNTKVYFYTNENGTYFKRINDGQDVVFNLGDYENEFDREMSFFKGLATIKYYVKGDSAIIAKHAMDMLIQSGKTLNMRHILFLFDSI